MAGVTRLFLLVSPALIAELTRFGHSSCNSRFAAVTLARLITRLRHRREKQHFEVVFRLMLATYGRSFEPMLRDFKTKKAPCRRIFCFNGGSDEARTRDLLRDRQAL